MFAKKKVGLLQSLTSKSLDFKVNSICHYLFRHFLFPVLHRGTCKSSQEKQSKALFNYK